VVAAALIEVASMSSPFRSSRTIDTLLERLDAYTLVTAEKGLVFLPMLDIGIQYFFDDARHIGSRDRRADDLS
jgi:hypothetical protein